MDSLKDFCKEYLAMWKNATNFLARTNVRGYWMAVLVNITIIVVLSFIGIRILNSNFLYNIYAVVVLIPSLAITVRRLNDIGKEWYWIFIGLIPIAGWIYMIWLLSQPSIPENGISTV